MCSLILVIAFAMLFVGLCLIPDEETLAKTLPWYAAGAIGARRSKTSSDSPSSD